MQARPGGRADSSRALLAGRVDRAHDRAARHRTVRPAACAQHRRDRSEARRGGKECFSTIRYRWQRDHKKNRKQTKSKKKRINTKPMRTCAPTQCTSGCKYVNHIYIGE